MTSSSVAVTAALPAPAAGQARVDGRRSDPRVAVSGPTCTLTRGGALPHLVTGLARHAQLPSARLLAPLLLALLTVLVWELAVRLGAVNPFFLPSPVAILGRVVEDLTGPNVAYVWPTLLAAGAGSLVALLVALPLGVLVSHSTLARVTLEPSIAASQALPAVAVAPLLVLWLGYGLAPVVVLCALMVFFPILVATTHALMQLDPDVVGAARLDGAARWRMLTTIKLPLALPAILTGIRNGFTIAVTGAIVGEIVTGGSGLGLLLSSRAAAADTTGIFSTLVQLCAVAVLVYGAVGTLSRRAASRLH